MDSYHSYAKLIIGLWVILSLVRREKQHEALSEDAVGRRSRPLIRLAEVHRSDEVILLDPADSLDERHRLYRLDPTHRLANDLDNRLGYVLQTHSSDD